MIPADTLMNRVRTQPQGHAWHPVPDVADLAPGEVGGFAVAGMTVLACRVGDELFAYHDRCGALRRVARGRGAAPPAGLGRERRRAAVPALPRALRRRPRGRLRRRNGSADAHLEPIPLLERDGVLSHGGRRGGGLMTRRLRRAGPHPRRQDGAAAGRRALRDVRRADRRRAPARGECRRQTADVRLPRLLPAVHRHTGQAALSRRTRPLSRVSRTSRWTGGTGRHCRYRSGWRSSSGTRRWTARSRSIPGPAGATESELDLDGLERHSRPPTRGSTCSPTTPRRCWCGCPTTKPQRRSAICCRSTPATSSSAGCGCCGTASTADSRCGSSSTSSSRLLDERSKVVAR